MGLIGICVRVTINFGGSVLVPDWPDFSWVRSAVNMIRELKARKHDVFVVVGGGKPARRYIEVGRNFGISENSLHKLGIDITRVNARLLSLALGDLSDPEPPLNFREAIQILLQGKVPVMGGTVPGHTTDAVAAMAARASNSDLLVYFTDVDGIYSADPKSDPSARKFDRITTQELLKLVRPKVTPGMNTVLDPVAVKLFERLNIRILVLGKEEISRFPDILGGKKHRGTEILR